MSVCSTHFPTEGETVGDVVQASFMSVQHKLKSALEGIERWLSW